MDRLGMRAEERLLEMLEALRAAQLYRAPESARQVREGVGVALDTRSNDYLGLATRMVARTGSSPAATVSRETGLDPRARPVRCGAGASRLVSGTTSEHEDLERELAAWLGMEAALVFSSAYAANVGALSALALQGDIIISDALNHASIIDGCRLSRAETQVVPHRDLSALAAALARPRAERSVRWVVTESYFSMDGTSPDLGALRDLCDRHEAALVVDETHSLGVFGPEGAGLSAAAGIQPDLVVGGLGKALGLQGGFVAGGLSYQRWLWNRARSFVFSTGVSPWLCEQGRAHVRQVRASVDERTRLASLAAKLERTLASAGVPLPPGRHGPLFPIIFGTEAAALSAAAHLERLGVRAQPIRPPTVPRGSARLRLSLRADMSEPQLELLASSLLAVWREHQSRLLQSPPTADSGAAEPAAMGPARMPPGAQAAWMPPGAPRVPRSSGAPPEPAMSPAPLVSPGSPEPPVSPAPPAAAAGSAAPGAGPTPASTGAPPELAVRQPTVEREPVSRRANVLPASQERWIVLGTGTGVGKSYVARSLVCAIAEAGGAVAGLKPIETGCGTSSDGRPREGDAALLEAASARVKHPRPHPLYGFHEPIAPSLAAHREGQTLDVDAVASWVDRVRSQLPASASPEGGVPALVIETAGGVFSPLSESATNFELACTLGEACWILVAPDRLGVLHDVTSTLRAMAALGRRPDLLVLSAPAQPDLSTGSNAAELRRLGLTSPIIELGRDQPLALVTLREASLRPAAE